MNKIFQKEDIMINILIAEDEHLERKAIKFFIQKLYTPLYNFLSCSIPE